MNIGGHDIYEVGRHPRSRTMRPRAPSWTHEAVHQRSARLQPLTSIEIEDVTGNGVDPLRRGRRLGGCSSRGWSAYVSATVSAASTSWLHARAGGVSRQQVCGSKIAHCQ